MTRLTVPVSNARPGRAARPVAQPTGGVAEGLADFGDIMFQVGTAVENDRLDRQMQRLQVDMMRDLNGLRLEVDQIGDPDAAEAAWASGLGNIRDSYGQPGEDGRPRLDPKNQERFGIAFDELANRHAFSLGRRTLALRNAERQATYLSYTHTAAQTYATGDPDMQSKVLADLDAIVAADLAAGRIDAAEAERRRQSFRAEGDNARAIHLIGTDPDSFLAARRNGEFAGLPADVAARYEVQAESALAAREKAAAEAEQKAVKAREKEIDARLDQIVDIAGDGRVAVDETFLADPEVRAHPKWAEAQAAVALREEGHDIAAMSPPELRALIEAERGRKVTHDWETGRLKVLEARLAEHEAGYGKDPVAYAASLGRDVPDLPEFDPAEPGAFAAALKARADWAAGEVEAGYVDRPEVLSEQDRKALSTAAAKTADPETRLSLAQSLAAGLDRDAGAATAAGVSKDPVFAWAVDLTARGADAGLVRDILDGQSKLAQDLVKTPSRAKAIEIFEEATGGDFRAFNSLGATVLDAAIALYSAENPTEDPASPDREKFTAALNRALGGGPGRGGGFFEFDTPGLSGGITGRRDNFTVILPVGVRGEDVERGFDALLSDLTPGRRELTAPETPYGETQARDIPISLDRLTSLSLTGAAPDLGDPQADGYDPAGLFGQMRFAPVWTDGRPQDVYLLYRQNGVSGREQPLLDVHGRPFTISLADLVRATR